MTSLNDERRVALEKCEELTRLGQVRLASRIFVNISHYRLKDFERLHLAQLAGRLGLYAAGFRLLHSHLRPSAKVKTPIEGAIYAQYSILLLSNGNLREASRMLERVNLRFHVDLLLAQAWCQFEVWNFTAALEVLRDYVQMQTDPYWNEAGRVNLAEAYLGTEKYAEALEILDAVLSKTGEGLNLRLRANALNLRAQAYFALGRLDESNQDIERALDSFGLRQASDAVLIRRQAAINQSFAQGSPHPILAFRAEAVRLGAWESIRECDFQLLKIKYQPNLHFRLYYGTPYSHYRRRLEQSFPQAQLPAEIRWGTRHGPCLDLSQRRWRVAGREIRATQQIRLLIDVLVRDFYRPTSSGEIFSSLFPNEAYDRELSPVRVHQCLKRLRQWLEINEIPLELRRSDRRYFLHRSADFSLLIPLEIRTTELPMGSIESLRDREALKSGFTTRDVQSLLCVSKATATRRLEEALERNWLVKAGRGKAIRYRFK